jgi:hypothetical protein
MRRFKSAAHLQRFAFVLVQISSASVDSFCAPLTTVCCDARAFAQRAAVTRAWLSRVPARRRGEKCAIVATLTVPPT